MPSVWRRNDRSVTGLVTWLNRCVAPLITAIGITPRSVTLEVRGRISGKRIRLSEFSCDSMP
jgi:hypothetical protein